MKGDSAMTCKVSLFALLCILFGDGQTTLAEEKQLYDLDVSVRAGDPNGEVGKGTLQIFASPKIVTQEKRAAQFCYPARKEEVGQGKPCLCVTLTVESLKGDKIQLKIKQETTLAGVTMSKEFSMNVKIGETVRLEKIAFGTELVWVEAIVRERKR
jgi:hypothetical protein